VEEWVVEEVDKMERRILIPVQNQTKTTIAQHFGRAPYFALFELDESGSIVKDEVHPNSGEHSGGRGHAHDNVLHLNPHVIIVQGMGPRGILSFQNNNIAVLKANSSHIDELIRAYNQGTLTELTEGCTDAHHK
jgi:predicted Fe-Mo cluster-binding NifX family protein